MIDSLSSRLRVDLTEQEVIDSPHLFLGSVDRLVEKSEQLRTELGITSIIVGTVEGLEPVVVRLSGT